jgi:hypothetical protein
MTNTYYFRLVLAEMTVAYSPAVSTPALWAIGEENASGIPTLGISMNRGKKRKGRNTTTLDKFASFGHVRVVAKPRQGGPTPMRSRPTPVTVAAVLLALLSLVNFVPLPMEGVPAVVVYGALVLGVVGLVAAAGLWLLKRWAAWLAVAVSALNLLSAAPGIAFAPTAALRVAATAGSWFPPSSSCWWSSRPPGALSRPPEFPRIFGEYPPSCKVIENRPYPPALP